MLFDLDGTLTDPFEGITRCISHALVALGRPAPPRETLRWCIGPPLREGLAKLLASDDPLLTERAVGIFRERFATVGLLENEVYAGIPEALAGLAQMDHVLVLATSKPTVYAERILAHFGLRRHFRAAYGSDLDGARSDKTELLSHILSSESFDPTGTVMVGDREHDMKGAAANAVRGIGVLWGYGTREELTASGAAVCAARPHELASAVETLRRASPARR